MILARLNTYCAAFIIIIFLDDDFVPSWYCTFMANYALEVHH